MIKDINFIRNNAGYKENFEEYINKNIDDFTASFVEKNLSFFKSWELDQIISKVLFSEEFLEKHYQSLDKSTIARHQKFSESFYMKHFNDLPASTVLKHGINDWRKKTNRSSKLDVFLRLKGVTY